jgi:hypothetical protein
VQRVNEKRDRSNKKQKKKRAAKEMRYERNKM